MNFIKLRAMARTRREIITDLCDRRSDNFLEHACYIIESNNKDDIQHWTTELYGFCSWIMRIKTSGFKLTKELILDKFFGCGEDLESFSPALRDAHYYIYKNYDYVNSAPKFDKYRAFVNEVAEQLATRELTQVALEQLVNKYLKGD